MTREIKFKVYAKLEGEDKFYFWGYERLSDKGNWEFLRKKRESCLLGTISDNQGIALFERAQLTPFKDFHGKEIYEGDIVRDMVMGNFMEVVFTDYGNFGLRFSMLSMKDQEYETIDPAYTETTVEITGNIHEN